MQVIHGKLLTYNEDPGGYVIYVFLNLDYTKECNKYLMCTKYPNWETAPIKIGDVGYLNVKEVEAGKDKWYNQETGSFIPYKYNGIQFLDFILEKKKMTNSVITL